MDEERGACQVSWGARINTRERHDASNCPSWVKPTERDRRVQKGLIVWQEESRHAALVLSEWILYGLIKQYQEYFKHTRPHQRIDQRVPCQPLHGDEPSGSECAGAGRSRLMSASSVI
jgi:hypothetical protein